VAGLALLAGIAAQDAATQTDWGAKVKAAIENPRYAVQRAASNEIARAGDAAVEAVRAYAQAHGADALPMLLVDAIAQARSGGAATTELLRGWASDRDFNWRAQALTGLALRESAEDADLFAAALRDPSHLFRVAGAKGLFGLAKDKSRGWDEARAVLADADPRARVMFALHLWDRRELSARAVLVEAAADDRAFLDDAFGRRFAVQAVRALASAAQTDFGWQATAALADNREAIARMAKWAEVPMPELRERDPATDLGGVEFRSCRHGDLFVCWTEDELVFDLDRGRRVALDEGAREKLAAVGAAAAKAHAQPRELFGRVVCDYVQVTLREPARVWKVAPKAVPEELRHVLEVLTDILRARGAEALVREVEARLPQFVDRG